MEETMKKMSTKKLVTTAVLTAVVIVFELIAAFLTRFGMFSCTFALVPIVIGAATCGYLAGAWLGFVFGVTVLISGDASAFLAVNVPATIAVVLVKGTLSGLCAGLVYRLFAKKNSTLAVYGATVVSPIVNTGVFLIGCLLFFMDTVSAWAHGLGFENTGSYMLFGLVGINFVVEFVLNLILSPVIVRLLKIKGISQ